MRRKTVGDRATTGHTRANHPPLRRKSDYADPIRESPETGARLCRTNTTQG